MGLLGRQVVGVDIGHSSVKVVGVRLGGAPKLIGAKEIDMDPKYLQKQGFENIEVIAKAIGEALQKALPRHLKPKGVYSVVSESLVFRKVIEVPPMPSPEEMNKAIILEVTQYLPEAPEAMEVDFQILGMNPAKKLQPVIVVGVSKKIIEQYLAIFAKAKLPLLAIEPKPSAIARAVMNPEEKGVYVLIEIGSEISTISIYHDGIIHVTGTTTVGGNILRDPETGEVEKGKEEERLKKIVSGVAEELDHVIKFYDSLATSDEKIKEIRLCGGGSMIVGIVEAMATASNLKVKAGQPKLSLPPFCDRRFIGALGSALFPTEK